MVLLHTILSFIQFLPLFLVGSPYTLKPIGASTEVDSVVAQELMLHEVKTSFMTWFGGCAFSPFPCFQFGLIFPSLCRSSKEEAYDAVKYARRQHPLYNFWLNSRSLDVHFDFDDNLSDPNDSVKTTETLLLKLNVYTRSSFVRDPGFLFNFLQLLDLGLGRG